MIKEIVKEKINNKPSGKKLNNFNIIKILILVYFLGIIFSITNLISLFTFGDFNASNIITEILRINKWIVFLVTISFLFIYFKSARNLNKPSKNLYKFAIFTGFLHSFHIFAEKMYVHYYLHIDMLNDATSILDAANFVCYVFLICCYFYLVCYPL